MNLDDFEQRLQQQPLRRVPVEWREDILTVANGRPASSVVHRSFLSTLNSQLSTLLWPHPAAWAGLAAVWIFIFALNVSMRDGSPVVAQKSTPPTSEMMVELKQQRRLLAELIGPRYARDADRSELLVPQPRSERGGFGAV